MISDIGSYGGLSSLLTSESVRAGRLPDRADVIQDGRRRDDYHCRKKFSKPGFEMLFSTGRNEWWSEKKALLYQIDTNCVGV
ncbi:hypothetical protein N7509_007550 [Penicillium cosmopolitanum]|uniref:Uncharacterized protein n=1 Tax=Penicillium cosmopolitanum TaxID=1131564 RepID=A0A9X0B8G6_9EURO|nr:uncharacterized protein N7509_007550 [Penicillium cosmopolitanum]KAJ5392060.1 hypothetical protein N7509_007550 [Penicillium cosmopolitanum]